MRLTSEFLLIVLISSCSREVEKKILEKKNLTEYTYDHSLNEVRTAIQLSFSNLEFKEMYLSTKGDDIQPIDTVGLLDAEGNENDYILFPIPSHYTIGKSEIYPENEYIAIFHLHLVSIGSLQTKVSVITIKPRITTGSKLLPNAHLVRGATFMEVEPSTVEEYKILLKIGEALKQGGMPDINLPR